MRKTYATDQSRDRCNNRAELDLTYIPTRGGGEKIDTL